MSKANKKQQKVKLCFGFSELSIYNQSKNRQTFFGKAKYIPKFTIKIIRSNNADNVVQELNEVGAETRRRERRGDRLRHAPSQILLFSVLFSEENL